MRRISYKLDIGYSGCQDEGETLVNDDMTNAEISEMVNDMAIEWANSWEGDSRLGWEEEMTEEENEEQTDSFYENVEGSWEFVTGEEA